MRWLSSAFASSARSRADGGPSSNGERPDAGRHAPARETEADSRKHLRGSGLLLSGRGLSAGFKFLADLLVIRYLATSEYGSWTYALSVVLFLKGMAQMGLHRAVARFLPMHLERGERDAFIGVLAFVVGTLLAVSLGIVTAFHAFPDIVAGLAGAAPGQSLEVLFIMVFLVPIDTLDDLLTNVCASFANSRAIFVRRYVLSPGLRVGVALLLVALQADVRMLAYGYLFSGLAGVTYYGVSVLGEVRRRGLLTLPARLRLPVRRVLSYTFPVMGADVCTILMMTTSPLLLGYFAGVNEVALFAVVVPLVALSNLVSQSFGLLFEPAFSRLHARGDLDGLDTLYWRSAVWVAVLSFPAFAIPFTAAEPLTAFLFGERYAAAAPILSLLALGAFADAGLGFNNATLRVLGQVRWLLGVNVLGAALNVVLNLLLIPRMGALGAAIATCSAFVATSFMKQVALRLATGVRAFDPRYTGIYATMAGTAVVLLLVRLAWPHGPASASIAVVGALVVLLQARRDLGISETFPELARWPALARLMG
jgi:O-antigen/teichoic acid export membrane protein